jgi:hypothetical protein
MKFFSCAPFVGLACGLIGIWWPTIGAVLLTVCVIGLLAMAVVTRRRRVWRGQAFADPKQPD